MKCPVPCKLLLKNSHITEKNPIILPVIARYIAKYGPNEAWRALAFQLSSALLSYCAWYNEDLELAVLFRAM